MGREIKRGVKDNEAKKDEERRSRKGRKESNPYRN